jgi:hypothetical protein
MNEAIKNQTDNTGRSRIPCFGCCSPKRTGSTLIDVAIGSMLLTVLLIPAIHMIGKSQSANRRLANRAIMLYEAEQTIENLKVALSDPTAFANTMTTPIDAVRAISVSDGPDLVGRSRVAADSTLPTAELLTIVADVWYDTDKDALFDLDEQGETLQTQWAAP